jgi:hypothetical protein
METTIPLKTEQFRFNIVHLLILIAIAISIFVLTNFLTVKQVAKNTPDFSYEGIAEEIYDAGTISDAVEGLPLNAALIKKMSEEIERILAKSTDFPGCEVYYLRVLEPGLYPILGYGDEVIGYVEFKVGDVWKVGFTAKGEQKRYPSNYYYKSNDRSILINKNQLGYITMYEGAYKQMLILEKLLIYTYSIWSGYPELIKPPGCKIFR